MKRALLFLSTLLLSLSVARAQSGGTTVMTGSQAQTINGAKTFTDLRATGTASFASLALIGPLTVTGSSSLFSLTLGGPLTVSGSSSLASLNVSGASSLASLSVSGSSSMASLTLSAGLNVAGASSLSSLSLSGPLTVSGSSSLGVVTATTLTATTGSVGTLTATTGTVGSLAATTGSVGTLTATTGTVGSLAATTGSVGTLTATTGNITTVNSTNGTFTGQIVMPKDTRRGIVAPWNNSAGDYYGIEQVNASEMGEPSYGSATRIYTSNENVNHTIRFGKYTGTTSFEDWWQMNSDGFLASKKAGGGLKLGGTNGVTVTTGSGSPVGVVSAPAGSIYQNITGDFTSALWAKISGTGSTSWDNLIAKTWLTSGTLALGQGITIRTGSDATLYGTTTLSTANAATLTATTGTVGSLAATTGSVGTLTATTGTVGSLAATTGSVGTLTATTGTIGTLNVTGGATFGGDTAVTGTLTASLYQRSGTFGDISTTVLGTGEFGLATDTRQLFIGIDGTTPGGVQVSPPTTNQINKLSAISRTNGNYNTIGSYLTIPAGAWDSGSKTLYMTNNNVSTGDTVIIASRLIPSSTLNWLVTGSMAYQPVKDTVALATGTSITLTTGSLTLISDGTNDVLFYPADPTPSNYIQWGGLVDASAADGLVSSAQGNSGASGVWCLAESEGSHAFGVDCEATPTAWGAMAIGMHAKATQYGEIASSGGWVGNNSGKRFQHRFVEISGITATSGTFEIKSPQRLALSDAYTSATITATIIAADSTGNTASFIRNITIKRTTGTSSLVGSVQTIGTDQLDAGASGWGVLLVAGGILNNGVVCKAIHSGTNSINWGCHYDITEIHQ